MKVFQPVGQKRLTNVAVVRYKKGGKRFEVACYKNKVVNWRNGTEKDLDEVLQSTTVFSNVSKAVLAKDKDLQEVFGTTDQEKICILILEKGEFQVSDKERKLEYSNLFKDVASILVDKCINPETQRPYTITMLERALRDVHFNPDPKRSAKQQALEALPLLRQRFPIERARMRLQVLAPLSAEAQVMQMLSELEAEIQAADRGPRCGGAEAADGLCVTCLVEPGGFRRIFNQIQELLGDGGAVQLLSTVSAPDRKGEAAIPSEGLESGAPVERAAEQLERMQTADSGAAVGRPAGAAVPSRQQPTGAHQHEVVYPRGPISDVPDEYAARRERFLELDSLQVGWTVELRRRGSGGSIEACFYDSEGTFYKTFADARRVALKRRSG